jgi:hypothetical protein
LTGFGKTAGRIGGVLKGAFAGVAVISGVKSMVTAASDLNETISKTETIFGSSAGSIKKWGSQAATSLGLSKQEALDGVSTFGNFFNQIGFGGKQTEQMSKSLVKAAVDLGSFHNAAAPDVMEALTAATRGEYDSLQKFIPTINAAAVQTKALAMTGKESASALTDQEKAAATYQIVMGGMGKAQGDFARTSGGLANQTKIAKAQFDNLKTTIGQALLPAITTAMNFIATVAIPKMKAWYKVFQADILPVIKKVADFLKSNLLPPLKTLGSFMANNKTVVATFAGVIGTVVVAVKAWRAAQLLLNFALSANPIGLVVIAIAALAAGLVYAYKKSATFRGIVDGMAHAIVALIGKVKEVGGKITAVFSGASQWLLNAGKAIIQGLIDGIQSMVGKVTGLLDDLTSKIPFHKGPIEKDRALLKGAGKAIMEGLIKGMTEGEDGVLSYLEKVATRIEKAYSAAYKAAAAEKKKAMKDAGKSDEAIEKALAKMEKAYDKNAKAAIKSTADEAKALRQKVRQIAVVSEELDKQKGILADLQQQSADYAKGIADAIIATGDITKAMSSTEGPASTADIIIDLQGQVKDAKEFADLIQSLTQQGLNKTAIQQLIDAGVEGGLATAKALAAGGPDAIREINTLQSELQTIGQNLGANTAATMYQAGIDIQAGIVKGITDDLGNLEAAATKLAKALVKAIKKALKIKSPSRVMMRLGEYTVAGLERGLSDTRGVVNAAKGLATAVTTGYEQPRLETVVSGGTGTIPINITLSAQQVDQLSRGRSIQADLDAYARAGGRSAA